MNLQHFTVDLVQISTVTQNVNSQCNTIIFINKGAVIVKIENFPLAQNESLTIDGNYGELCTKTFNIKENTLGQLWVVRKTYTK